MGTDRPDVRRVEERVCYRTALIIAQLTRDGSGDPHKPSIPTPFEVFQNNYFYDMPAGRCLSGVTRAWVASPIQICGAIDAADCPQQLIPTMINCHGYPLFQSTGARIFFHFNYNQFPARYPRSSIGITPYPRPPHPANISRPRTLHLPTGV